MNGRESIRRTKISKLALLIFLVGFAGVIVSEIYYRDYLYLKSITIIKIIQENMTIYYQNASIVCGYIGSFIMNIVIFVLVFNYGNIYKSFLFLLVTLFSNLLAEFFRLLYKSGKPYYSSMDNDIVPYGKCNVGYGNPSRHSVIMFSAYLTLWMIIKETDLFKRKLYLRIILGVVTSLIILAGSASELVNGSSSLNEIIFGSLLGLSVFIFIFFILKANTNSKKQFKFLIEISNLSYFIMNFIIIVVFLILLFVSNLTPSKVKQWETTINDKCNHNYDESQLLKYESLIPFGMFFANLGAFIGIKFEIYYIFQGSLSNWLYYNFSNKLSPETFLSISNINISEDTQWNHTAGILSFVRLVIIVVIIGLFLLPQFFVPSNAAIWLNFIFKIFIPANLLLFTIYFLTKILFKKIHLSNSTLFVLHDQENLPLQD